MTCSNKSNSPERDEALLRNTKWIWRKTVPWGIAVWNAWTTCQSWDENIKLVTVCPREKKVYYYQRRQNLQWRIIRNKLWREDPTKDRRIQTDKMYVGTYCLRSSLCYDMHRRKERKRYFKKWLMWSNEAWEKYRTSWARRCLSDVSDICEASSFGDDRVVCLTGTVINHAGERMTAWQNNISYLHMRVCVCWGGDGMETDWWKVNTVVADDKKMKMSRLRNG